MIGSKGGIYNYWNCFKVLPTVYEDSLSYYEVLCKLTYTIDQVIKQIDTDNSEVYKYINEQDLKVLSASKNYTDSEVSKVNAKLAQLHSQLTVLIKVTDENNRAWTTHQILLLKDWISKQGNVLMVTNPITGKLDSIQNVLNEYYNLFNYYALTCIEYDTLGLTCDEYVGKELTSTMYDYYGKKYLWFDNTLLMFHPVTGVKTCYKNVIDMLVQMHREDSISCSSYDDKQLTTTDYDNYNMECFNYDWYATTILN